MSDPDYAAAGVAIGDLADNGVEWVSTYVVPAAITVLGIGLVVALLPRFAKKIRGWL